MSINPFCVSSFLTFRYVATENVAWTDGVMPAFPALSREQQVGVRDAGQILEALSRLVRECCQGPGTGILLSGGIDSAILAALMPRGTPAYTVRFVAEGALDESPAAAAYAERYHLRHRVVDVTWEDCRRHMDLLMLQKRSPLHPVEVGLFKAASLAASEGITTLVLGNGADSTFGGLDKLLSRDWTFEEFVRRYTFVDPALAVKEPVSMLPIYEQYRSGDGVRVSDFLKTVHGLGVVQAFDNAIRSAGCTSAEPYEQLFLDAPLDIERIRQGESKYLLRALFDRLYPGMAPPTKIAFARPMDQWMRDWAGTSRPEFLESLDVSRFTGEQRWLLYCLERFLNLVEN